VIRENLFLIKFQKLEISEIRDRGVSPARSRQTEAAPARRPSFMIAAFSYRISGIKPPRS
jgi:hypothetical protein